MPLRNWRIVCCTPGCGESAEYKIAARWSDGVISELKTYALSCGACLAAHYPVAVAKKRECPQTEGEVLDDPRIYRLVRGERDRSLEACPQLEAGLVSQGDGERAAAGE